MKDGINSRNHQNVVQIPFHSLRNTLKSLCEGYGLVYQEQEESYKGYLINSDTNGAANIGRNSKQNGFTRLSIGYLAQS
jgi:transposase